MVHVGIIQMQSTPLDIERNLSTASDLILKTVEKHARLVVLPEMFNVGFSFDENLMKTAETLESGRTINWLKQQAATHDIWITTSIYERLAGHFYNTMVMVGADGSVQFYRKRNPTCTEATVWKRSHAPGPGIFETPFGRIGGVICFDSFARETYEGCRMSDVDMVVIVACWGAPAPIWTRPEILLARATLNRWSRIAANVVPLRYATELKVPTVFVNQGGRTITSCDMPGPIYFPVRKLEYRFYGNSHVRNRFGEELVRADRDDTFCAVVPVDIGGSAAKPAPARKPVPLNYLRSGYYFTQPPLMGKVLQHWFYRGLQKQYDSRCQRQSR